MLADASRPIERSESGLSSSPVRGAALLLVVAWSAVPIVALAYHTARYGGVVSGSSGPLAGADQMFYMDSIRQSGQHVLIADHFDLTIGDAVFVNPLFLVGGVLWRLGLPLQAAFWSLNLLSVSALVLGASALARRVLSSRRAQMTAVALGLFYLSPLVPLLAWTGTVTGWTRYGLLLPAGESMPAWQLWGYPQSGLAVGLEAAALLGACAMAKASARTPIGWRLIAGTSAAACLAAWLHPWQGATLIVVLVVLLAQVRSWRLLRGLGVPLAAAVAPLAYEAILPHVDRAWHVDSVQDGVGQGPVWMLLVALLPLALPAVAGVRAVRAGPLRTVLIAWPLAGLAVYFGTSQFPYHALQGISLPLAVLAVAGWPRLVAWAAGRRGAPTSTSRSPAVAVALLAVAVVTIPGVIYEATTFGDSERAGAAPYWFTPGERAALSYLEQSRTPGGVLARQYLGMAVPAFTARRTWVGEWAWSPGYAARVSLSEQLMSGQMPPATARRLVHTIGARFALTDCRTRTPLDRLLGPLVVSKRQFGCAAVYELSLAARRVS
jgi:hypothetical protein